MEFGEYLELWKTKSPELMDRCGMDDGQRSVKDDYFRWTIVCLERIGDAVQTEGLVLNKFEQYQLSILYRSLCSYARML